MTAGHSQPLLRALGAAAEATTVRELATALWECVAGVTGVDTAVLAQVEDTSRPIPAVTYWTWPDGFLSAAEAERFEQLNRDRPWVLATHTRTRVGRALRISDRLSRREYRGLPIYSELFRPLEIDHQLAFSLPIAAGTGRARSTCVALNRSRRDFSDAELEQLELLRRPLSVIVAETLGRLDPAADFATTAQERPSRLSSREAAVLELLVGGYSNQQIGRRLGISPRTVEKHLEHVYAKTGARSRIGAALWWRAQLPVCERPTTRH